MDVLRMAQLKMQGYCCSQIIMQMGLEGLGKENKELIAAARGLCRGMHQGLTCGALSAAVCLMHLIDQEKGEELSSQIWDWFQDCFGSTECDTITEGNPLNRSVICGNLVENTYRKLTEILEENDIPFAPPQ